MTTLALGTLAAGTDSVQNHPEVAIPSNMPHPKFWFGQQVCHEWALDDDLDPRSGKTFRDYGVIVGMNYQQPGWDDGWVYLVKWEKLEAETSITLPCTESAHEDDLQLA